MLELAEEGERTRVLPLTLERVREIVEHPARRIRRRGRCLRRARIR